MSEHAAACTARPAYGVPVTDERRCTCEQGQRMSTERGQGELVEVLRGHEFDRLTCFDHDGRCDPAGCHDLDVNQYQHLADVIQAHVDAEVAAVLEGAAAKLLEVDSIEWALAGQAAGLAAATIVREQIPTSGGGAV